LPWYVWVLVVVVGLVVLDRLALAAEARGWVYWRRRPPTASSAGDALMSVQALFEPGKQHVVEEAQRQRIAGDEDADDEPR
jgi:hypothetical protein